MSEKPSGDRLLIICLLMPVLEFLAFGLYGYCDTDQGFIQALSWRIYQGEVPYLDFIYVRPPLSIYLHSLPLMIIPHDWIIAFERFMFYFFIGMSVFWTTRSLEIHFDFREIGLSPEAFALMAYILSVHNFPPMPWHTVDGIFFASLGFNRISRGKTLFQQSLGILAMIAAAMCKQAFYPMLVVGPVLLGLLKGWKPALLASLMGFSVFLGGLITLIITMPELIETFWFQTTGSTSLEALLQAGFYRYLKPFILVVIPLLIVWRAHSLYDKLPRLPGILFGAVFFVLLGLHVYQALRLDEYVGPAFGFSQVFFLLAVGIVLKGLWLNPKAFFLLLAMLTLSWCVGISWGYANNMLFFSPILFGFIYGLYEEFHFTVPRYFYSFVIVLLIWIFGILYQYPYHDAPRDEMYRSPADIFPEFTLVYTGEVFLNKTRELKQFHQRFGDKYSVLPAYPLAHFLTHTNNPISTDWAHNAEVNYVRNKARCVEEISTKVEYILIEKDKKEEARNAGPYGSLLTGFVLDNWEKVETGNYFEVYRPKRSAH